MSTAKRNALVTLELTTILGTIFGCLYMAMLLMADTQSVVLAAIQ